MQILSMLLCCTAAHSTRNLQVTWCVSQHFMWHVCCIPVELGASLRSTHPPQFKTRPGTMADWICSSECHFNEFKKNVSVMWPQNAAHLDISGSSSVHCEWTSRCVRDAASHRPHMRHSFRLNCGKKLPWVTKQKRMPYKSHIPAPWSDRCYFF